MERIETQNLGKAQTLGALPTVAPLNLKEKIVTAPPWIQTEREQYLEKHEGYLLKFSPLYLTYQVFADARRFRSLSW